MRSMRRINIRFKAKDLNTVEKTKGYIEKKSGDSGWRAGVAGKSRGWSRGWDDKRAGT